MGWRICLLPVIWVQNTIIWDEGVVYCQYMSTECNYMEWNEGVVYCQYMSREYNYMEWRSCLLPVYEYRIQLYEMKVLFTASIWVENTVWRICLCQYMSTEYNYMIMKELFTASIWVQNTIMGWRSCLLPVYEYRIQLYGMKVLFTASIWVQNTIIWNEGVVYCQYMSTEYNYMEWRSCLLPVYEYRIQLYGMKVLFTASYMSTEYNYMLFTEYVVQNTIIWDFVYCQYEYSTIIWILPVYSTEWIIWRRCRLLPVYEYRIQLYGMKELFTASIWVQNTIIWNEGVVYCHYMSTEYNYM